MRIELSCAECGGNRFSLADATSDETVIVCEECGHEVGTLGQVKQDVAGRVLGESGGAD